MRATDWCRGALRRLVPMTPARIALFCAVLALASLRCISDFIVEPGGGAAKPRFKLAFLEAPAGGVAGVPIATIRVAVRDGEGRSADAVDATVTLQLVGVPGATLSGQRTVPVVNGTAVFRGLTVDRPGTYRLIAVPSGAAGIAPDTSGAITLELPRIKELELSPDKVELDALGDTASFAVTAKDEFDRTVLAPALTWTSTNEAVAVVDAAGRVTARGNGDAEIRARSGDVVAKARVEVRQRARSITLTPADLVVPAFGSAQITASVTDANGRPVAGARPSWSSNRATRVAVYRSEANPLLATVRRFRSGTVTITAKLEGVSGTATVR